MGKWMAGGALVLAGVLVTAVVLGPTGGDVAGTGLPRTITTAGTASVRSTPDQAVLRLGVKVQGKTSEAAFAKKGERSDRLVEELVAQGVGEADIQTIDLRLFKRTQNRGTPQESSFFVAETDYEIILRELDRAGEIAAAGVGAGATSVRGIEFRLVDQAKAKDEALREAIESARMKAEAMAGAAGAEVGEVRLIDETNSEFTPYRAEEAAFGAASVSSDAMLENYKVEPGEVTTQVTATVVWELDV